MKRGLEIKLLNYFLLITIAAMMIGIEFFFEINQIKLMSEICSIANTTAVSELLLHLRNKIVIMFGVLTIVVAIVLMMFIKNITWPLQHMVNIAQKINDGDLSQVIKITPKDELGQLGIAINDLTKNLQEIAAFTATTSKAIQTRIDAIKGYNKPTKNIDHELQAITLHLESLQEFVSMFHTDQNANS